jgi:hypothetical protein
MQLHRVPWPLSWASISKKYIRFSDIFKKTGRCYCRWYTSDDTLMPRKFWSSLI